MTGPDVSVATCTDVTNSSWPDLATPFGTRRQPPAHAVSDPVVAITIRRLGDVT
jgi:hypothetical protein